MAEPASLVNFNPYAQQPPSIVAAAAAPDALAVLASLSESKSSLPTMQSVGVKTDVSVLDAVPITHEPPPPMAVPEPAATQVVPPGTAMPAASAAMVPMPMPGVTAGNNGPLVLDVIKKRCSSCSKWKPLEVFEGTLFEGDSGPERLASEAVK